MRLFTKFIKKTVIIHYILLNNITKICSSESYYSYDNPETFQNQYQRTEAPNLSGYAFADTSGLNTNKEYLTPDNEQNYGIQPSYRPSYMFESEFSTSFFPKVNLKSTESEQKMFEAQKPQNYNTNQYQAPSNTFDHTQQWLIPDFNSPQVDLIQPCYDTVNNGQYSKQLNNYYNDPEIQRKFSRMYQNQESSCKSSHNDQDIYVGNPNYCRGVKDKLDIFTDEIYSGYSLFPYTPVKSVCSAYNQPLKSIEIGNSQEFSVVLPPFESIEYIFPNINKDTTDNYTDLKNIPDTRNAGDIQNVCHYNNGQNIARTTNHQNSDSCLKDHLNGGELTETNYHDSYHPSFALPIYDQYNTELTNPNIYNSSKAFKKNPDSLPLDINTTCQKEHFLSNTEITSYRLKRPYSAISDEIGALYDDTHTISDSKIKHIRKNTDGTIISVTETFHSADTSVKKLNYKEFFHFSLNNQSFVFKRVKETNIDRTIILDCSNNSSPKAMDITYENFLTKYIHHSRDIKKLSFYYTVPLITPLNFQISGPLLYLKLTPVLKEHELNQNVYGIAYFEFDSSSHTKHFKAQIILENTIPQDLNTLIELIMDSKFPIYDLSGVKYNEFITYKKIEDMASVSIVSTREFLDWINKQKLFMNYRKDPRCKYNNVLDIPIHKKPNSKYYVIIWEHSMYLMAQAILDIFNQLKKIKEIISDPNIIQISMKSNIKKHIKRIIRLSQPEWAIRYIFDKSNKYEEKVNILSFFYFFREKIRKVLEHWDKYILSDKVIKSIEGEVKYSNTLY